MNNITIQSTVSAAQLAQGSNLYTRRHFIQVAEGIARIDDPTVRANRYQEFSKVFHRSNPRFNRERFRSACNV